jgi:hypothetical protein
MKTYRLHIGEGGKIISSPLSDGNYMWIPTDPNNSDYQEYLLWLAEGNEPEVIEL